MSEATQRLSAALGDRYRIERELDQGGMADTTDRRTGGPAGGASDG